MTVRLGRSLEGSFANLAGGRVLVIDAYRSRSCCAWVGDITARWEHTAPDDRFVPIDPIEGVPVIVRSTLTELFEVAGVSLHRGGLLRPDGIRVELARPELWIAWLEHPGARALSPADRRPVP